MNNDIVARLRGHIAPPIFHKPYFRHKCCCCIHHESQEPPLITATGTNILMAVLVLTGFCWLVVRWVNRGGKQ